MNFASVIKNWGIHLVLLLQIRKPADKQEVPCSGSHLPSGTLLLLCKVSLDSLSVWDHVLPGQPQPMTMNGRVTRSVHLCPMLDLLTVFAWVLPAGLAETFSNLRGPEALSAPFCFLLFFHKCHICTMVKASPAQCCLLSFYLSCALSTNSSLVVLVLSH
jgi:hypothetical protein